MYLDWFCINSWRYSKIRWFNTQQYCRVIRTNDYSYQEEAPINLLNPPTPTYTHFDTNILNMHGTLLLANTQTSSLRIHRNTCMTQQEALDIVVDAIGTHILVKHTHNLCCDGHGRLSRYSWLLGGLFLWCVLLGRLLLRCLLHKCSLCSCLLQTLVS